MQKLLIGCGVAILIGLAVVGVQMLPNETSITPTLTPQTATTTILSITTPVQNKETESATKKVSEQTATLHYRDGKPAYFWKTDFTIPTSSDFLYFEYKWTNKGNGAYLSVHFGDNHLFSVLGTDFVQPSTNDGFLSAFLPAHQYQGKTAQLLFTLNPGGTEVADVVVKGLALGSVPPPIPPAQTIVVEGRTLNLITPKDYPLDPNILYYKDTQSVYIVRYGVSELLVGADPATFIIDIPNNYYLEFALDKNAVYSHGARIFTLSNPISQFIIFYSGSNKDCGPSPYLLIKNTDSSESIYFGTDIIQGADLATFEVLWTNYSKDKNYVYSGATRTSYNPTTFDLQQAYGLCPIG